MAAIDESRYYTVSEAARILGVSPSTIWRWIQAEKLCAYRVGPRTIRLRQGDLAAIIQPARPRPRIDATTIARPVTPEELARRQDLVAQILEKRKQRVIAPLSSADLVHAARKQDGMIHDPE